MPSSKIDMDASNGDDPDMIITPEQILDAALALPDDDRARVAVRIVESLDPGGDDVDAEDAWAEVVARRLAEIREGRVEAVPADVVLAGARSAIRERR